jgi:hypothetical protein
MRKSRPSFGNTTTDGATEMSWEAERTAYADCFYAWVHGGRIGEDGAHIASIKWPESSQLTIPQKVVIMSVASFAELAWRAEEWNKHIAAARAQQSSP